MSTTRGVRKTIETYLVVHRLDIVEGQAGEGISQRFEPVHGGQAGSS
jgi:hypothetical protein